MQDFIQLMITSMELKGFAKNTQKTYLGHIRCFAEFCSKNPASAGYDDVRAFLHHSITERKLSSAYVNSAYGAIKFFFQYALCREWNMLHGATNEKEIFSSGCFNSPRSFSDHQGY
jgi:site-specific recombinase XerD